MMIMMTVESNDGDDDDDDNDEDGDEYYNDVGVADKDDVDNEMLMKMLLIMI